LEEYFHYNDRLGIQIPVLNNWESLSDEVQQSILLYWEKSRGSIPDRIIDLEKQINCKQEKLEKENNFELSCQLNNEIAELASIINDLWLWFRTHQDLTEKRHL
jgi:hypothetical protein